MHSKGWKTPADDYFAAGRMHINLAEDLFAYRRARPLLLGSSIVAVVKTAEPQPSDHTAKTEGVRSSGWRFLGKPEVRSVLMVVAHVIGEQSLQVEIVQGDDVIQQIAPAALNPSLRDTVLPRTLERGSYRPHGHRPHCYRNLQSVLGIPIKNEKPRSRLIRERFPQLLDDPKAVGMPRDIEMQNAPASVADDEETVEHPERDGRDRKQVHGGDGFSMITQKGEPTLGRIGISRCPAHPAGDGPFGNIKTEHQNLTVNTRCAPGWILVHHPKDQIAHLLGNPLSPYHASGSGQGTPIERESRSVPTHHGLWADDKKSLFPSRPESSRQDPEELIERS
jgi:hypothetical protein